jgi:hypothetical protein
MSTGASPLADGVDSADAPAFIDNPAAPMISATAPMRTIFENFNNRSSGGHLYHLLHNKYFRTTYGICLKR